MESSQLNIAVLTSSRADYGIYLPLLKRLKEDVSIHFEIIAFGSHCSKKFGNTVDVIEKDGFEVKHKINNLLEGDTPEDIALTYANTVKLFSNFWNNHSYNWVLCLGDRFEMAAAVNAGIPFGVNFAHFYAGDTTLGAIDNIYRDQISLASKMYFTSLSTHSKRLEKLLNCKDIIAYEIGAISLENLKEMKLLEKEAFKKLWKIDLSIPTILVTIHPETVDYTSNKKYAAASTKALEKLASDYQIVITMPNADTSGSIFRAAFLQLAATNKYNVKLIENFGTLSYFTCMQHACLLIGNTSSGIIEAASFGKYVLNLGERQQGRIAGENVLNVSFNETEIVNIAKKYVDKVYKGTNLYQKEGAIDTVINALKKHKIK